MSLSIKTGEQELYKTAFIEATKVEYDLKKRQGFINNAYGVINFETLDLISLTKSEENHVNQYTNFDKLIRDVKVNAKTGFGFLNLGPTTGDNTGYQ